MTISRRPDTAPPSLWLMVREGLALSARFYRAFGAIGERGPPAGRPLMVIPGFVATDRTTLGLQRALAADGWRVTGWGLGINSGVRPDTRERIAAALEAFGRGEKVTLVGWSLGGVYAREVAKLRPDLVAKVITLGSPFSGDPRGNNAWRLYEMMAGHPVDEPPMEVELGIKPPVPTLAIWSRGDGIVAPACARGEACQSDRQIELDCTHMGFAVSGRAYPRIVAAIRDF
ncbi:alpha/beta hydrolase [Sphingosinicella sp. LHD-64]|uniref:alpha/beta hydrolase n=1 Tax=Sphingosinicella sp. LHD-64 TaxID=3072139 RepID=UPI00280C9CB2|nr:alpha/beta hydrolase [Sphingosinicella sp. LHD-64]MDQ8756302.1 alpha/beta hydrolase [Sphingosinicella sp. LHD-64]